MSFQGHFSEITRLKQHFILCQLRAPWEDIQALVDNFRDGFRLFFAAETPEKRFVASWIRQRNHWDGMVFQEANSTSNRRLEISGLLEVNASWRSGERLEFLVTAVKDSPVRIRRIQTVPQDEYFAMLHRSQLDEEDLKDFLKTQYPEYVQFCRRVLPCNAEACPPPSEG